MRYFYILILTLILISCNEKKGYSQVFIEYGEKIVVTDESECRNVVEKGKILTTFTTDKMDDYISVRILHKGYIYFLSMNNNVHICSWKKKFHDK
tara:strand:- start:55 stop:339 length:285 start_codon:yes stop_codon:yes gene_type:complete